MPALQGGVDLTVALIGFFCIPQVLDMVAEGAKKYQVIQYQSKKGLFLQVVNYLIRKPFLMIRSALIGLIVGIMPGVGGNVAALLSYNEAVRWSKNKAEFGKGIIDGVAATETANCSVVQGSIIPMLTLGIPGFAGGGGHFGSAVTPRDAAPAPNYSPSLGESPIPLSSPSSSPWW